MRLSEFERLTSEDYLGPEEEHGTGNLMPFHKIIGDLNKVVDAAFGLQPACESPIEIDLGARLKLSLQAPFRLEPQYQFGRYRMDFAVLKDCHPVLFIECDGREFHSSAAQQANDRAKDVSAALARIPLLRFTGSRIYRRVDQCCAEVVGMLEGLR